MFFSRFCLFECLSSLWIFSAALYQLWAQERKTSFVFAQLFLLSHKLASRRKRLNHLVSRFGRALKSFEQRLNCKFISEVSVSLIKRPKCQLVQRNWLKWVLKAYGQGIVYSYHNLHFKKKKGSKLIWKLFNKYARRCVRTENYSSTLYSTILFDKPQLRRNRKWKRRNLTGVRGGIARLLSASFLNISSD